MSLPSWFSDFTIEQCLLDEVLDYIPPSHRAKAESRKVFRVDIDRTPHYIIAGSVFARVTPLVLRAVALLPEIEVNLRFDAIACCTAAQKGPAIAPWSDVPVFLRRDHAASSNLEPCRNKGHRSFKRE
jgi:hypothetical protein